MGAVHIFHVVCPWLAAIALVAAAASDMRSYEIPDTANAVIGTLYLVYATTAPGHIDVAGACIVAFVVFLVGAGLFATGAIGGGDVKLLSVTALWAGPGLIMPFLFATAMSGGVLSLTVLLRAQFAGRAAIDAKPRVPYGIAIAAGGLFVVARISSF